MSSNPTTLEYPPIPPEGVVYGADGMPDAAPPSGVPPTGTQTLTQRAVRRTLANTRARLGLIWIAALVLMAVFAPFLANSFPLLVKMNGRWSSPALRHITPVDVILLVTFAAALVLTLFGGMSFAQKAGALMFVLAAIIPLAGWRVAADEWRQWVDALGRGVSYFVSSGLLLSLLAFVGFGLRQLLRIQGNVSISTGSLRRPAVPWRRLGIVILCLSPVAALLILFPVRPPLTNVYEEYRDAQRAGRIDFALRTPIPYSPNDASSDEGATSLLAPSQRHLMGTDVYGQDVASRMLHASRIALSIGFVSTGIAALIGMVIGGFMGYFVGVVDLLGMRLIEIFESIPTIFLLITVVAFFGHNLYIIMAVIGLTGWSGYARFVRAEFLKLRNQDFVHAAYAAGLPLRSILFRHMLPNGISPVLVSASFGVAGAILSESTLSFLGLGLVDEASWGQMLNQALGSGGSFYWWIALYPGLAIFLTVLAYNLVGEALRDALDPKLID